MKALNAVAQTLNRAPAVLLLALCLFIVTLGSHGQEQSLDIAAMPAPPGPGDGVVVGEHTSAQALIAASTEGTFVWGSASPNWREVTGFTFDRAGSLAVGSDQGLIAIGGLAPDGSPSPSVSRLSWNTETNTITQTELAELPNPLTAGSAFQKDGMLYVTNGEWLGSLSLEALDGRWQTIDMPAEAIHDPVITTLQGKLLLFGQVDNAPAVFARPLTEDGATWTHLASPPRWSGTFHGIPFGISHVFFFATKPGDDTATAAPLAYHAITDTWFTPAADADAISGVYAVAEFEKQAILLRPDSAQRVAPAQLPTNYSWVDNLVVAAYLLGMIGIGWYFTKRESSSNDFFRGGQRIPWWAAGMSLFATGASAISLAGMPGMGYGTDWTYFTISICSALCLPIGIFIMAPLVRRLQIKTANEYLERRFGVTARLFASVIFMFTQIASRIASVMLLSAIALEAITDIDIVTAIIIMGVVTTIYTYLGGLEAVIWTDTVQGFVMVATVVGCLVLALLKLDQPVSEMWSQVQTYDKGHMFDWSTSIVGPTTFIFFVHTLFLTFGGISDQNFVQRVQSTPDLKQTKLAVATQMAVAVPINVLLFSLGTALWLFYRSRPDELSPTIVNNDGVFPFFAAQQLPIGVSGIVVAALLAATMSTVSSSICAVSDLGTNDFFRRFKHNATDHQCLILGRVLTAVVGALGTVAAIVLASIEDVKSVWDLAIMVTGLISSSVLGLFMLGLLTRKTHELGALIGAAAGMTTIILMKNYCPITFWLYIVIGPIITIAVGLIASLILPGTPGETRGLTLYSLRHADAAPPKATPPVTPA